MTEYQYKAFISYSHDDEAAGDWLHSALERYVVPDKLVGKETSAGVVPKKLVPIFRDKDDLPAAGNLNDTIVAAITNSQFLIVLSSPNAVKSKWVDQEIKLFKSIHGPDRVLAIIIDGEPHATENPDFDTALECFPPSLRFNEEADGSKTPAEPLAADARDDKDGKKAAITKLAAGLIGVRLDDLVQREAKRAAKRARQLAMIMGAAASVFALTTVYAVSQRNEAQKNRNEAEGLIDFMITDVRQEVQQKVGNLDTLESLSNQALEYYERQNARSLSPDALGRRARALHAAGEIRRQRNNLEGALEAYKEAEATTEELLRRDPTNTDRIFEHAQSVFYVGHVAYLRNDLEFAEEKFLEYSDLAQKLYALDPTNLKWQTEVSYAMGNLGSLKFENGQFEEALTYFENSSSIRAEILAQNPSDLVALADYGQAVSWEGFTYSQMGEFEKSIEILEREIALYEDHVDSDFDLRRSYVVALRRIALHQLTLGRVESAKNSISTAIRSSKSLLEHDAENTRWKINAAHTMISEFYVRWAENMHTNNIAPIDAAIRYAQEVLDKDGSLLNGKLALLEALSLKLTARTDDIETAEKISALLSDISAENSNRVIDIKLRAIASLATHLETRSEKTNADELRREIIAEAELPSTILSEYSKFWLLRLYVDANHTDKARSKLADFEKRNIRHPVIIEAKNALAAR